MSSLDRRQFFTAAGTLVAGAASAAPPPNWSRPVHRVANAARTTAPLTRPAAAAGNANLVRGLDMAAAALERSQTAVNDYTAVLVKRETVAGTLGELEYMRVKIRNRKQRDGRLTQPMSVYINFLKPSSVKGREVLWVENQNDGKMIAHEGGFKGKFLPTVTIPPDGMLAMRGQRYPMTDIGVENLIVKLIERGNKALQFPDVSATFRKGARVQDRSCTVLQVTQPTRRPTLDFYQAQVFIDDKHQLPIRYVAYDWPAGGQKLGGIIEEYNYLNLQVNVGLTDGDFDAYNKSYNFYG